MKCFEFLVSFSLSVYCTVIKKLIVIGLYFVFWLMLDHEIEI